MEDASRPLLDERRKSEEVHCRSVIRTNVKPLEQRAFEPVDTLVVPDITYFDPAREKRADGIQTMKDYLTPIAGKVNVDRYEMIDTKVQRLGDAAVLSYQLISHAVMPDGSRVTVRWNSTKVYGLIGHDWKLVHDHWSFIKPELKNPLVAPQ